MTEQLKRYRMHSPDGVAGAMTDMVLASEHAAAVAAAFRASHRIQTHGFEPHEMTWNERCPDCGLYDYSLSTTPCSKAAAVAALEKRIAELRSMIKQIDDGVSDGEGVSCTYWSSRELAEKVQTIVEEEAALSQEKRGE